MGQRWVQMFRNKEIFRQFGGFLLILFYTWTATPEEIRVQWAIAATVLGAALRAGGGDGVQE